jgi:hypothetical protein
VVGLLLCKEQSSNTLVYLIHNEAMVHMNLCILNATKKSLKKSKNLEIIKTFFVSIGKSEH